jgi:hypothetical protein
MSKDKAIALIIIIGFVCFWLGGITFTVISDKNDKFWQEVILDPEHIEQIEMLIEENEAMVDRLIQLQQGLNYYIPPKSSPDIERVSREE